MALASWYCKLRGKWHDAFHNVPDEEHHKASLKHLRQFTLLEIQAATDNFSRRGVLTRCGFGKVYKGRLGDGIVVAVKRFVGEQRFRNEIEVSNMVSHRNLLHIHGFCMTKTERILVYSYMANGSLESRLRERTENHPPLDWLSRKRIAKGSARGLAYLHNHCAAKIIHLDVKAANILLDEHYEAVIGDFELATVMDHKVTHVTSDIRGTIGHIAPEYLSTGELSEKTDVFGYGMMLLELITGQRVFDRERLANGEYVMLLDWVKGLLEDRNIEAIADAHMQGNYAEKEVVQMIQVALICTQSSPLQRPNMSDVVYLLEGHGLAENWEEWLSVEEPWTDLYFNNPRVTTHTI